MRSVRTLLSWIAQRRPVSMMIERLFLTSKRSFYFTRNGGGTIALDIKRPTANRDFEVVEGDNGNVLEVTLTDDGVPVDLAGCRVYTIFSKSDGTAQQDNDGRGITVEGNKLTISLYTTSVAPGLVECELQVYSGEEQTTLVTSAKFNFMCRRGIANDDTIEATDEWPLLVDMIQRTEAVEEAEALRVIAESGRENAEDEREAAEAARGAFADKWRNMGLVTHGLPHTEHPTGTITEESDRFIFNIGLPKGEPGTVNSHAHGNITSDGKIGTTANRMLITGEDGAVQVAAGPAAARAAIEAAKWYTFPTVPLVAASWTGTGPYTQTVTVDGMTADMEPLYDVVHSATPVTADAEDDAFVLVTDLDTVAGNVTFSCRNQKPTANLNIRMRVVL